jgi:3-mercaptopyruvate sulfurtransferase SseA
MKRYLTVIALMGLAVLLVSCGPSEPSADTGQAVEVAAAPTATAAKAAATPPVLTSPEDVQRISPAEVKALLDSGAAVLYDARAAELYQALHAAGAISFPEADAAARLGELPDGRDLIFYCT